MAVSPSIVSGRVVATMIISSASKVSYKHGIVYAQESAKPEFSIGYANEVIAPNSNFSLGS